MLPTVCLLVSIQVLQLDVGPGELTKPPTPAPTMMACRGVGPRARAPLFPMEVMVAFEVATQRPMLTAQEPEKVLVSRC